MFLGRLNYPHLRERYFLNMQLGGGLWRAKRDFRPKGGLHPFRGDGEKMFGQLRLAVLMGYKKAGATRIIGIDINSSMF